MKARNLFLFIFMLLLVATVAVGATESAADPEYITVTQPVTNIWGDISAVVRIGSAEELAAFSAKENKPAIAIFEVDSALNVLDENGNTFSTVYGVIGALDFSVIPAYYADNTEEATAVAAYLASEFTDAFIISSDPSALKAAKDACPLLGLVADYTHIDALSGSDYAELRSELYGSYATVIMLDGALCTKDTVSAFKAKRLLVWASLSDAPTKTEIFGAVNSGAVAVVSDDSDSVIDLAASLAENTMTRAPQIQAHRGYSSNGLYVENTKESIINAYLKGAKAIEFDIHLSAPEANDPGDGSTRKLVLYHDGVTKEADTVDGVKYDISDSPWSVLYDKVLYTSELGYEYRLSHLEEVFEYIAAEKAANGGVLDLLMTIEIKPGSNVVIVDHLFGLLEKYDLFEQSRITTFSMSYITRAKELNPTLPTNYLQNASVIFDSTGEETINAVRELIGPTSSSYSPSAYYGGKVDIGPVTMRTLLRRGYMASYWGLGDNPENYLYYGILGFGTDYLETTDPIVTSVLPTGLNEELKVPSGRTVEIGAAVNKRIEMGVPVGDFKIHVIEGKELIKAINGGKITFADGTGKVSFAIEYLYSAGKLEYTVYSDPVTLTVTDETVFEGGVSMEGYSIRYKEYNGLRGLFTFDKGYSEQIEKELGYTLIEFGAIVVSEEDYIAAGNNVALDKASLELTTGGYKAAIWSEGEFKTRILGTADGVISYCLAIVDFDDTHSRNVYYVGYSAYESPEGEIIISYDDYDIPEHRLLNLYQLTLDMYVNGAINSSNTDDAAVWNTLLTGVVTLTEGTDYAESDTFGDTFTMKEFSACGKTEVSAIKLTVVNDPKNNSWVLIYRGSGNIPGTAWDVKHQLASQRGASYAITNPILTAANDAKIKTVVIDHGITGVGGTYAFAQLDLHTLVYPETFETMKGSAFYHCPNIRTVYCAHGDGIMRAVEEGLADYSYMDSFAGGSLYINVSNIPSKLHLPGNITAIDAKLLSGSYGRNLTKKIWCGNSPEPAEGVIDLTGANIESIGNLAFDDLSSLNTLILPDSCTALTADMFTDSGKLYITKIMQKTYNAEISAFCTANSISYRDLMGNEYNFGSGDIEVGEDSVYS